MTRMTIGDFARASGLTRKALRLYDDMDLLRPVAVDDSSGYRYYDPGQLDDARLVAKLRLAGMSLGRIRAVVDLPGPSRSAELLSYWRQVEADHASRRAQVTHLVDRLRGKENPMSMNQISKPSVASRSGIGSRDDQLDAICASERLFAVADGFGDYSELPTAVLDTVAALDRIGNVVDPVALFNEAVDRAAHLVDGHPDSGCTLSVVMLGESQAAVAHVGDSRVYLVRAGRMQRLTRDHTYVQALVDEGRLTPEEARGHEDRAILNRAIAPDYPPAPDISIQRSTQGDRFVLTTDGVHGVLSGRALADLVTSNGNADETASAVEAAVIDAGAPDNYAVVVIDRP